MATQTFLLISLHYVFFSQLPASESTRPMDRWALSASSLAAPAACISGPALSPYTPPSNNDSSDPNWKTNFRETKTTKTKVGGYPDQS